MTRIGAPLLHSSRWSTKSSRPVSAKWESSKTSTTVPLAAIRSKKIRQAANRSSEGAPDSIPRSASSAGSTQRRSASSAIQCAHASRTLARVVGSSSVSRSCARARTISPSAQKVIPSPYAGDRPLW